MNMTFKAFMMKEWTLLDDCVIVGKKEIKLSSIFKVEHSPLKSGQSNGVITITYGSGAFDFSCLAYPRKQQEDGEKAAKYIIAVVDGKDPNKAVDQWENGYRKYCNVCGHIYCYSREDIQRNRDYINDANKIANRGILDALAGNSTASEVGMQSFNDQMNRIVDFSKCPKCGSKDIRDATDEDIEKAKAPQGQIIQQISVADELKKYKELLDMGVITQEEFDAKKKQLLNL